MVAGVRGEGGDGGSEGGGKSHGRTCEAGSGLRWRVGGGGGGGSSTDANPSNVCLSCLSVCFLLAVSGHRQTEGSEHKDTLLLRAVGCAHAGLICSEFICFYFYFFPLLRKIRIKVKY